MNKGIFLVLIAVAAVLALPFSSAHQAYYEHYHSTYVKPNYYKDSYTNEETHVSNTYNPWGEEKRTTTVKTKEVVEKKDYNSDYYGGYGGRYYEGYSDDWFAPYHYDNGVSYTSWRHKPNYDARYYGKDSYTRPYYYQPEYDWHLQYYNWRY